MYAAIYQNKASHNRKYLNITIDPEEAVAAGVKWDSHPAQTYVWYEEDNDKIVIVFDRKQVPADRIVIGKATNLTTDHKVAFSKLINPISKLDPRRCFGFTLAGAGIDESIKTFERHPIDCRAKDGRIVLYGKHLRVLGEASAERKRLAAKVKQPAAPLPASEPAQPSAAPPSSSTIEEILAMKDAIQDFLERNPRVNLLIDGDRKVSVALA